MNTELPRDLESLLRVIKLNGWRIDYSRRGHIRIYDSKGHHAATTSGTPSDYRAVKNFRADLKRAGLKPMVDPFTKAISKPDTTEYFSMTNLANNTETHVAMPKKQRRKARPAKALVLRVLRDANAPMSVEEVTAKVQEKDPLIGIRTVCNTLSYCARNGMVKRVGRAEYRSTENVGELNDDDMAVLNGFLDSLARVEQVIRKHINMANALRAFR